RATVELLHGVSTSAAPAAASSAATTTAGLERRSDAVLLGGNLRSYSLRVVVRWNLTLRGFGTPI
ncbi:hypothetical protein, partial [Mycolicibacterium tusciae]|uniref:hypothetical protein n=1 Tax=Mycolicibacterium tusciae TaxID=75922 RepID=UPI001A9863AB